MTKTLECENCGAPHKPDDERCEYCGQYFDKKKESERIKIVKERIIPLPIMPREPIPEKIHRREEPGGASASWYVHRGYEKKGFRILNASMRV